MKAFSPYLLIAILLLFCFGCDSTRESFVHSAMHSFRTRDLNGFATTLAQAKDVNIADNSYKWTLLHLMINEEIASDEAYFEEIMLVYKRHGGNLNAKDLYGRTPLYYCVIRRLSPNIYKSLLAHGADPNLCDKQGRSPLDYFNEQKTNDQKAVENAQINIADPKN